MNNNINKRASSIARGINRAFWFNKLKAFFAVDVLIIAVSFGLFCYKSFLTIPSDEYVRSFTLTGQSYDNIVLHYFTDTSQYNFPMHEHRKPSDIAYFETPGNRLAKYAVLSTKSQ